MIRVSNSRTTRKSTIRYNDGLTCAGYNNPHSDQGDSDTQDTGSVVDQDLTEEEINACMWSAYDQGFSAGARERIVALASIRAGLVVAVAASSASRRARTAAMARSSSW